MVVKIKLLLVAFGIVVAWCWWYGKRAVSRFTKPKYWFVLELFVLVCIAVSVFYFAGFLASGWLSKAKNGIFKLTNVCSKFLMGLNIRSVQSFQCYTACVMPYIFTFLLGFLGGSLDCYHS